ncbi:enoyl-CoA delta isomerase 2, mitochondrial [Platysternon megacephalum]|uniref:RRP15-like protein n=1 Tax=Platysternon megacephalum TaxID=55544 RepID=A0A4D9ERL8_9SAUR|nr:enoyl-CoA delta isomerase 2, mitochondrial [Platysternon megacephalum]
MAAAMEGPRGVGAAAANSAEESGSEWSSELPEDGFSSEGEALDGDDEDEATAHGNMDENEAESQAGPSAGWAEAMAKVLNKKIPKSKSTILVKSKELEKEREKEKQEKLEKKRQLDKKREWEMMCRVKPDVAKDRETERNFQRIATRGVVQLFNAVRKHQKTVDEKVKEAGNSNRKRTKLMSSVSKKDFINMLRGSEGAKREQSTSGKTLKSKQKLLMKQNSPMLHHEGSYSSTLSMPFQFSLLASYLLFPTLGQVAISEDCGGT